MIIQDAIGILQHYVSNQEHNEAIELAVSAMEKQYIAKKPELSRRVYWCPVCEGRVTNGVKHCGNCGQFIDWNI